MKWEAAERPASAKSDEQKAIEAMSKLTPEQLAAIIAGMQVNN